MLTQRPRWAGHRFHTGRWSLDLGDSGDHAAAFQFLQSLARRLGGRWAGRQGGDAGCPPPKNLAGGHRHLSPGWWL